MERQWNEEVSQMWLTETKAQPVPEIQNVYQNTCVGREGAKRPLWVEKEDSLQWG